MLNKSSRKQAIKDYCLWCTCGQPKEVKLCPAKDCPLWVWRLGYEVDLKTGQKIIKREDLVGKVINISKKQ